MPRASERVQLIANPTLPAMAAPLQWPRTSSGDRYSTTLEPSPIFPSLPTTPSPIQRQYQPQQRQQGQRGQLTYELRSQRQPPSFPSHAQVAEARRLRLSQEIASRKEAENLRLRINNLDGEITALELKKNLESFGEIADVTVERNENSPKNHAIVLFESRPRDIQGLLKVSIGDHLLDMDLLERKSDGRFDYVSANCLELGVKTAQNVFCREFSARSAVAIQFQENRRMIKITFKREFRDTTIKYQVEMKFHDMDQGCVQIGEFGDMAAVTIRLRSPPMYWRYDPKMESSDTLKWSVGACLRRVVDIPKDGAEFNVPSATDAGPVEPNPTNLSAKLGRWTVIRLMVGNEAYRNLENFRRKCKTYNLLDLESRRDTVQDGYRIPKPNMEAFKNLAFEARYMLESALSFNFIVEYDLTSAVAEILCGLEPLKASMILEHIISNRQRVWDLKDYLEREAAKLSRISSRPRIVPPQCVYLRKVMVTPTTIHLLPPTVETSNRIIRHFSHLSDYFLRVEFSDEGNNRVWSKDSASNENNAIYNRIFSALTNGIRIGDREYQFLAFSASQLRDNSAWFFCSQGGYHTVDSIHHWMGNFSHIKSIAKYAARMGQCFSSTRAIATLSASEVEMIDDIEYDNHNFSDGCGRISLKLAQMIGNELEKETTPVAFQIRLGGSKGVLVWYPPLREKRVQIRPSMKKFDVAHYVLEVIKTSAFIPSYLNRQIIILLSSLGVPDQVILDLKNNMMKDLEKIESDDLVAIKNLVNNWDENGTSKMMVTMIKAGFLQNQDPFIKNLLTLFKLQMLDELSKKARIRVPNGAYLLGVCDETGGLKEGEIFVQVSSTENPSKRTIIEGNCVVVRCPCFHPGDVRVVRAVKCPALNHLHDVVVFNTKGTRGIPSMCSGGDLDGDDFTVIWDPNIVNNVKQRAPMDYTGRDAVTSEDVTIRDIKKFFVQYAVSNNLGVIANAHLALSDSLEEGPHHGKCLRLAQLHSDAVDFPKTGKPAWIKQELRPKKYPDFMEKPPERSYESKRVLGRIYRECGKQEAFVPKNYQQSFNRLLLINGYQDYMNDARRCKAWYDEDVRSLMNQYGVKRYI
ncbi:RNA dependent RNA polymerase-domain-containing protein [Dissophora ornata]|nr:RNA dependent RNA polymerase-domain-containing protein [Dissophora ornata]